MSGKLLKSTSLVGAFLAAFKLPNFLRRLFAEGAFAHAFVPVLSNYKENHGEAELKDFIDKTAGTLALILFLITVAGVIAAPLPIMLLAPAFTARMVIKTPVRFSVYAIVASLLLNVLAIPLAHAGLALATSLGAAFNASLLLVKLRRDRIYLPAEDWGAFSAAYCFGHRRHVIRFIFSDQS